MSSADDLARTLRDLLDGVARRGSRIAFWWRDDDVVAPSAALDDLLAAAARHGVPLALAVIPEPAGAALADRLAGEPRRVVVLQHGFAHRNHAPAGAKAAELGADRPADIVLAELVAGRHRLAGLFGGRFLPVLTPPWNRVCDVVARRRAEAGLPGLTTFARMHAGDPHCLNTHLDIVDWKRGRVFAGQAKMLKVLQEEIDRRLAGDPAPIGLLTHHLVHDQGCRDFLEAFLSVAATHPAVDWPPVGALFEI